MHGLHAGAEENRMLCVGRWSECIEAYIRQRIVAVFDVFRRYPEKNDRIVGQQGFVKQFLSAFAPGFVILFLLLLCHCFGNRQVLIHIDNRNQGAASFDQQDADEEQTDHMAE